MMRYLRLLAILGSVLFPSLAHATGYAYIADIQQGVQGGGTTVATNVPSATANGDLLYMIVPYNNQNTVTFGAGVWVLTGHATQAGGTLGVYCHVASAEPGSYTITFGTSTPSITELLDVKLGPAGCGSETVTTLTHAAATTFTGPTITPASNFSLVIEGASQIVNNGGGSNIVYDINLGLGALAYPFRWGEAYNYTYMHPGTQAIAGLHYKSTNSSNLQWQGIAVAIPSATPDSITANRYLPTDGMMSIVGTATSSIVATNPPAIPNGDQGFVWLSYDSTSITLTAPAGWTLVHACWVTSQGTICGYKHTAASESLAATYTWTPSSQVSDVVGSISYFRNVTAGTVDAVANTGNLSQAEVMEAPSVTPSQANDLVCNFFQNVQTSGAGGGAILWNIPNTPLIGGITNMDDEPIGVADCFIQPDANATAPAFAGFNDSSGNNGQGSTVAFKTTAFSQIGGPCFQKLQSANQFVASGIASTDAQINIPFGSATGQTVYAVIDTGPGIAPSSAPTGWTQIDNAGNASNNESNFYHTLAAGDPPFFIWPLAGGSDAWVGGSVSFTNVGSPIVDAHSINHVNSSDGSGNMPNTGVTTTHAPDIIFDSWIVSNTDDTSVALPVSLNTLWNYGTDTVAAGYNCASSPGVQGPQTAVASNTGKMYTSTMAAFTGLTVGGSGTIFATLGY